MPASRAGDLLTAANSVPSPRMASLTRQWFATGIYRRIDYLLVRSGVPIHASVILVPADLSEYQGLRLIALVYFPSVFMFSSGDGLRPAPLIFTSFASSRLFCTRLITRVS